MKGTVENKKGLNKDIKVFIDKKTMDSYMNEKYEEIKSTVNLKGFRPGKVPKEILKRQFGKAVFGEVLDKVIKDTSTKALEEKKIKPAGQPKIDLKKFGEDKELEYEIIVTDLPKVDIKELNKIKINEYDIKIDNKETEKRIEEENRVIFRYSSRSGDTSEKYNPNGSINNIAGIINDAGNILGMMPHPEKACEKIIGSDDGLGIFSSIISSMVKNG